MRVVGFNFTKINIEKFRDFLQKGEHLKANTKIDILEIKEIESSILKTKETLLGTNFEFSVDYEPKYAQIVLKGNILITVDKKIGKDVIKQWKKKEMPETFRLFLFNAVLKKSNLKSLFLEDELNLPLHMPLFSLKKQNKS